jgi:predicted ArsR family transcriptional regulator
VNDHAAAAHEAGDDVAQQRIRVIAEPARYRLLRHLVDAPAPATIAELTAVSALNHTTVREHVAKLEECGLVSGVLDAPTKRRGRPRRVYRATGDAHRLLEGDTPYEHLAHLLLDALATGDDPVTVGRRAGHRVRSAEPETTSVPPVAALARELARQGFEPTTVGDTVLLGRCPFATAAARDPDTVCRLHLGLAHGLADAIGGVEVDDLVRADPQHGGCRLLVRAGGQDG